MDNTKNDLYYIRKILSDLSFVLQHTEGLTQAQLEENPLLIDSVMFRFIQIAENNEKLTAAFKNSHPEVPWRSIKGMRNLIVHDYGVVDLSIVYDTVITSVPHLYEILRPMADE